MLCCNIYTQMPARTHAQTPHTIRSYKQTVLPFLSSKIKQMQNIIAIYLSVGCFSACRCVSVFTSARTHRTHTTSNNAQLFNLSRSEICGWRKWILLSYSFIWDNDIEMLFWDVATADALCSSKRNSFSRLCIKCHHNLGFLRFIFYYFFQQIKMRHRILFMGTWCCWWRFIRIIIIFWAFFSSTIY